MNKNITHVNSSVPDLNPVCKVLDVGVLLQEC